MNTPQALMHIAETVLQMRYVGSSFTSHDIEDVVRECQPLISATEGDRLAATLELIRRRKTNRRWQTRGRQDA